MATIDSSSPSKPRPPIPKPESLKRIVTSTALVLVLTAGSAAAQTTSLYWGDTHLHTSYSTDAYQWGNVNADPDTAYRFAKGLPVVHPSLGYRVRLGRPLDFLVVSDHAAGFGIGAPVEVPEEQGGRGRGGGLGFGQPPTGLTPAQKARLDASWPLYLDAAEKHYEPGVFTTLIGWEWTAMPVQNLHRVVFTPTDGETARLFRPFSNRDSDRPEDLWAFLEETSERLGIDFVAIPHNSNLSAGFMFDMVDSDGRPITAEYARTRMRWEPVMEIAQVKGTSETHPALSPNDEFANFEIYTALLMGGTAEPNAGDYARTALLRGLVIEDDVGVNPYKFGFQGATDSHTGLASAEEDNFFGKSARDSIPSAGLTPLLGLWTSVAWDFAAQGLTGVWATENTREGITAAFKRKEVYGTTGPRISLRVFGGWDFDPADANARDIAAVGYREGIPMGGDLTEGPSGQAPSFLIQAVKDPIGANLDRVQVIKGWLDSDGETHEQVYDVAWSDGRVRGPDGRLPAVGNTVDLETLEYENTIGSAELATVWEDPNFDPDERAFYYVRVIEIPTPRHSAFDAVALGMDPETAHTRPATIQERAYSSPIWYTP